MEEFNKENGGNFDGFNNTENINNDENLYTKKKEDIIQDSPITTESFEKKEFENHTSESKENYYQSSNYASYNYTPPSFYQKPKNVNKEKRYGAGIVIVASILAAIIGCIGGAVAVFSFIEPYEVITDNGSSNNTNVKINVEETATTIVEAVAKKVTPSVVGIRTTTSVMSFFGGSQEATGDGSGVIYSADGYIITNYHVISDAVSNKSSSKIEVYLDSLDSDSYLASVVGYNISADLAVIKIDAKNLTPVDFGDSSTLKVGQYVITIGNPGGLEFIDSVTYGVISGLDRVVSADSGVSLIQTDAAINPGNSGGALLDVNGRLVGINSAKIVSEEFEGMGFAIPSNTVKEICDTIISKENAPEPYVGVSISERYTADVLSFYGFPSGAVVLSVAEGSPAENAGIQKGDIITEFGGKKITEYTMFEEYLKEFSPDQNVDVVFYRSGRYYSSKIKIGSNN